jgi:hypothetical protein
MQSKGRARAKQNAAYVLFMDESNAGARKRDIDEYQDYEEIEKVCCLWAEVLSKIIESTVNSEPEMSIAVEN